MYIKPPFLHIILAYGVVRIIDTVLINFFCHVSSLSHLNRAQQQ
ncbi:Uncharacterised protein [Vibrio cholerae]|nr:Uncharacterised protein [Vibrio cholerae]